MCLFGGVQRGAGLLRQSTCIHHAVPALQMQAGLFTTKQQRLGGQQLVRCSTAQNVVSPVCCNSCLHLRLQCSLLLAHVCLQEDAAPVLALVYMCAAQVTLL